MTLKTTTIRVSQQELDEVTRISGELAKDKSDILREAIQLGLREIQLNASFERYRQGKISSGRLCEETGFTQWEIHQELKRRGIYFRYGDERFREEVKSLVK